MSLGHGASGFEGLPPADLADLILRELDAGPSPFADVLLPNRLAMVAAWLLLHLADEDPTTADELRPLLRRVGREVEARRRGEPPA
jgi:hypothetical protein